MTAAKKAIQEKAVLVTLNFRNGVSFTITDQRVTKEVEEIHQTSNSGRYVKTLFRREDLQGIFDAENIAKRAYTKYTLPWFDDGVRILPIAMLDKYGKTIEEAKTAYNDAVKRFIDRWDEIMESNKERLKEKDMYNELDYPSKEAAAAGFRMSCRSFPIPDKDDFRIDASNTVVDGFRNQYARDLKEYEDNANSALAKRLGDSMASIIKKLSSADKKITDNALLKLSEMVKDLKGLNVTGDKNIAAAINDIEKNFAKETAEVFNANPELRSKKKEMALSIVGKLETNFPRALEF